MSKGYVYILSNQSMPGLVKIGKTTRDVFTRATELFQTGVPTPFDVEHYVASPDCHTLENTMHALFDAARVSGSREFFICSNPTVACDALDAYHRQQVNDWLGEFLPDHTACDGMLAISDELVVALTNQSGANWYEVIAAINSVTAEEIAPAIKRYRDRIAESQTQAGLPK